MSSKTSEPDKLSTEEEKLLNNLLDKGIRETKPKIMGDSVIYDGLEDLSKEIGDKEIWRQLNELKKKEYLIEKSFDSAILCPKCGSIQVYSRYNCPQCQSMSIERIQLIEHTFCGYIGNRIDFVNEKELICPKCKTKISESATEMDKKKIVKVIGSSFVCDKCGSKFERPSMSHICQKCGTVFTYRDANYVKLPSYELTEKVQALSPQRFERDALHQVETIFKQNGYTVELDAKIMGKSGAQQSFDLIGKKDQKLVLLDVSTWGSQTDLISLLGKKMDIDSKLIILLDLEGNTVLPSLGKAYNISVVNGKDPAYLENLAQLIGEPKTETEKRGPFWRRGREDKGQKTVPSKD
ncbi:MAG: hypothetical protein ABSA11_10760 [Candidatus Bathyarchaeia archaeon]|jgi:rubrerythrin